MAQATTGPAEALGETLDSHTTALRIIAGLLVVGAAYLMGAILVPFALALVLAIALGRPVDWLARNGVPNGLAALLGMLAVAAALAVVLGLLIYQAGTIVQQSDRYLGSFSQVLARASRAAGGDRIMQAFGVLERDDRPANAGPGRDPAATSAPARPEPGADSRTTGSVRFWERTLRRYLGVVGRWVVARIGGLIGVVGGLVLFLAYLFYMLQTRADWIERLTLAMANLGLRPRRRQLERIRGQIVTYVGCLGLVSVSYMVVLTLVLWLIGVPQPLLWGVLSGVLEIVPYVGPAVASALPTIVALSLGTAWQPLAVLGAYLVIQFLEGYVVAPMLYGGAVRLDPVTVMFGLLFFGWLWGPAGLMVAMPLMIILRGLLLVAPDTPALDALFDADGRGETRAAAPS